MKKPETIIAEIMEDFEINIAGDCQERCCYQIGKGVLDDFLRSSLLKLAESVPQNAYDVGQPQKVLNWLSQIREALTDRK